MFDVVPPTPNQASFRRRSGRRPARPISKTARVPARPVGEQPPVNVPPVVTMDWRLPARLRRPVRDELARQRRRAKARKAIVEFERRPIYSSLPDSYPSYQGKRNQGPVANTGAEHHTGDVYRYSRPGMSMTVPPYQGRFKRNGTRPARPAVPARSATTSAASPTSIVRRPQVAQPPKPLRIPAKSAPVLRSAVRSLPLGLGTDVRDVPYSFPKQVAKAPAQVPVALSVPVQEHEDTVTPQLSLPARPSAVAIKKPKRRFALPLHFSVLPLNLTPKKKLVNLGLLLVACILGWGIVSLVQGAGRGYAVLGAVTHQAQEAYMHVIAAQSALAATKFDTSEQEFSVANQQLADAHKQLSDALAASEAVLKIIDVTGKVRSGDELLTAGQQLTTAGEHVSKGLEPLLKAQLFVSPDKKPDLTMVDAITTATQEFTTADDALKKADDALKQVDVKALPSNLQQPVTTLKDSVPKGEKALSLFLDQSQALLTVLGAQQQRQYLVVFENNDEQRPTGGFIGSLALLNVDRGLVEHIDVQSVYDPDGQLKDYISPPEPLRRITNRWYLRDANWFVDFKVSAEKIADFFEKENGPTVDGVIALTPEVIKNLLKVTGPIEVPGYNVTVNADNFVALTQDEVTYNYDKQANKPKQFLADLTPILLNKLFSSPSASSLQVLGVMGNMISEKQLLLYFKDPDLEQRLHTVGWDGTYPTDVPNFLSVNNANIGGHKSDQFIEQDIDYQINVASDGTAEATATIRRTHHGPTEAINYPYPPGEDPSKKDNVVYQRVLVPKGSTLLEAHGFTAARDIKPLVEPDPSLPVMPDPDIAQWQQSQLIDPSGTAIGQEAGYTTFANWQVTAPGATTIGVYRYRLPGKISQPNIFDQAKQATMYVAKQPGDTRTTVRMSWHLPSGTKIVHTSPDEGVTYEGDTTAVYRGALNHDVILGTVFTKS